MKRTQAQNIKSAYAQYQRTTARTLDDLYNSYSVYKKRALLYCQELCEKYGGKNLKLFGANCTQFSAGFEFTDSDGVKSFAWITKANDRYMHL